MKKDKSGLWNAGFGEIGATLKSLENQGASLEILAKLRSNPEYASAVAAFMIEKAQLEATKSNSLKTGEVHIVIDYSEGIKQMMNYCNIVEKDKSRISSKNFPTPVELTEAAVIVTSKFFSYERNISSEAVFADMDFYGFRPATIFELLAYGKNHPDMPKRFPIAAIGSDWHISFGNCFVPVLVVRDDECRLLLTLSKGDWSIGYRFLGVRK